MTYRVELNGNAPEGHKQSYHRKDDAKVAVMDLILALTEGDEGHVVEAVGNGQFLVYHHGGVDAVNLTAE